MFLRRALDEGDERDATAAGGEGEEGCEEEEGGVHGGSFFCRQVFVVG